jgi:FKBP-type peptidyl-prolyl cis-trans isomerase (trigger factor)
MEPQAEAAKPQKSMVGRAVVIILVLLIAGAAYYVFTSGMVPGLSQTGAGAVLASVNGAPITQADITERLSHAKTGLDAQGVNPDDPVTRDILQKQALEEIINETLVLADAEDRGIAVTESEVDAQYTTVRGRFATDEEFQAELSKNNFTEATLRENVRRELTLQKYVSEIATDMSLEVTEEEVAAFYKTLEGQTENVPPLAELKTDIENQLRNQKLATAVDELVNQLRANAEIVITADENAAEPAPES